MMSDLVTSSNRALQRRQRVKAAITDATFRFDHEGLDYDPTTDRMLGVLRSSAVYGIISR